jgi:hypothetical protein
MSTFLLHLLVIEVIDYNGDQYYETYSDLIDNYYKDQYMDNEPFLVRYVQNDTWQTLTYTESAFMEEYHRQCYQPHDDEDGEE